jgi:hypothetical protein
LPRLEFTALNAIDIKLDQAIGLILDFRAGDIFDVTD